MARRMDRFLLKRYPNFYKMISKNIFFNVNTKIEPPISLPFDSGSFHTFFCVIVRQDKVISILNLARFFCGVEQMLFFCRCHLLTGITFPNVSVCHTRSYNKLLQEVTLKLCQQKFQFMNPDFLWHFWNENLSVLKRARVFQRYENKQDLHRKFHALFSVRNKIDKSVIKRYKSFLYFFPSNCLKHYFESKPNSMHHTDFCLQNNRFHGPSTDYCYFKHIRSFLTQKVQNSRIHNHQYNESIC